MARHVMKMEDDVVLSEENIFKYIGYKENRGFECYVRYRIMNG